MGISIKRRFEIFHRDRFTCRYCGRSAPHVHLECEHVLARVNGGTDLPDNLVTSCFECNRGKGTRAVAAPPPLKMSPQSPCDIEWLMQDCFFDHLHNGSCDDTEYRLFRRLINDGREKDRAHALVVLETGSWEMSDESAESEDSEFDDFVFKRKGELQWTIRNNRGEGRAIRWLNPPRNQYEAIILIHCVCGPLFR